MAEFPMPMSSLGNPPAEYTRAATGAIPRLTEPPVNHRSEDAQKRRERKRQVDRVAQQKHRKRQKLYIEELEARLQTVQTGGQSDIARLMAENVKLREELEAVHSLWDGLEELVRKRRDLRNEFNPGHSGGNDPATNSHKVAGQTDQAQIVDCSSSEQEGHGQGDMVQEPFPAGHSELETDKADPTQLPGADSTTAIAIAECYAETTTENDPLNIVVEQPTETEHFGHVIGDVASWWMDPYECHQQQNLTTPDIQRNSFRNTPYHSYEPEWNLPSAAVPSSQRPPEPLALSAGCDETTQKQDDLLSATRTQPPASTSLGSWISLDSLMDMIGVHIQRPSPEFVPSLQPIVSAPYLDLPFHWNPPAARDAEFNRILGRTRENADRIGPPNLADFLFDNRANTLSMDLKSYLEPIRKVRGTSEFLATYWILYLLFRWQATRDQKAYNSLPLWMRPTQIQLVVQHPTGPDQVVWPAIREELVWISLTDQDKAHEIEVEVGKHLVVDLEVSQAALMEEGSQKLQEEILNIKNWKLRPDILQKYPQWKGIVPVHTDT